MTKASFSFLSPLLTDLTRRAAFIGRASEVPTSTDKEETLSLLRPTHQAAADALGFKQTHLAEQVHGVDLAIVEKSSPLMTPGVDGLLTSKADCLLGIHVADCGALYLADSRTGALGLLHSGKKGTEGNILGSAILKMGDHFGTSPADLTVVLAPCIRPPHYEIDFAATIREQALAAGILASNYHDEGLCTASHLDQFYSYRIEKGNTGRMLALLGTISGEVCSSQGPLKHSSFPVQISNLP
jgi:copper oxidase (laccase) domain-containing protein